MTKEHRYAILFVISTYIMIPCRFHQGSKNSFQSADYQNANISTVGIKKVTDLPFAPVVVVLLVMFTEGDISVILHNSNNTWSKKLNTQGLQEDFFNLFNYERTVSTLILRIPTWAKCFIEYMSLIKYMNVIKHFETFYRRGD